MAKESDKNVPAENKQNTTPGDEGMVRVDGTFADAWKPEEIGAQLKGLYLGAQEADGKRGKFKAYHFKDDTGKRWSVSGAGLNTIMPQIPRRTRVTVVFKGVREMDRGEMRVFDVLVPKGVDLIDPFDAETD